MDQRYLRMKPLLLRWMAILAIAAATLLFATEAYGQSWKRDIPNEGCRSYADRIEAPCRPKTPEDPAPWPDRICTYKLWKEHWCASGQAQKCRYGSGINEYWSESRHGCRYKGISWQYDLGPGETIKEPVDPKVFSDDFETGGLTKWSSVIGSPP